MTTTQTLLSWNVNGIRAVAKKGFADWLAEAAPDILCLQETRAEAHQVPAEIRDHAGYHTYWNHSKARKGYSGTGLLTREEPINIEHDLGVEEFDQEGRTLIAEYPSFVLLNCYFPNGGRGNGRVPFKLDFYQAFLDKCEAFRAAGKTVIFCGDVNTAHREIDLARPKENQTTTGFLPEEREWMDRFVAAGYVDTFRLHYPDLTEQYTWWDQVTRARDRNVGWRIDYFFIVAEAAGRVEDAFILPDVLGSDHCPVGIRLAV